MSKLRQICNKAESTLCFFQMSDLPIVIVGSLIGSVLSLVGGIVLLTNKKGAQTLAFIATPFAAGTLLGAAFFDLLPDALEHAEAKTVSTYIMVGLVLFFLLQRFIHVFHHEHRSDDGAKHTGPLIIIGDTVHNALDGVAIAAAFLINVPTGLITSFAVAVHEVPQEVGDFGLLLKLGYDRWKVLAFNLISSFSTTPVAVTLFLLGDSNNFPAGPLLGMTVGFFVYIAVADLIPRIHSSARQGFAWIETSLLIGAILLVGLVTTLAHDHIDQQSPQEPVKASFYQPTQYIKKT